MNRKFLITTAIAAALLAGGAAHAESDRDDDRRATTDVKITMQQAIEAAERHADGKAKEAELEHEGGRSVYEIEVRTDGGKRKVYVSATDGTILTGDDTRSSRSDD